MERLPTPTEWQVGQTIFRDFQVTGILGQGGMGTVYQVYNHKRRQVLAVKCPQPELVATAAGRESFVREAETWVKLGVSPHIVQCYFVLTLGGLPRIFAEYVAGGSLKDAIEGMARPLYQGGPAAALARILDLAIQVAWGLDYAHHQGLVHQDVKPGNVLLTPEGIAKVTDFGLARARLLAEEATAPGGHGGYLVTYQGLTPAYCSPEQAARYRLSLKTDLWSWGILLLELFAGGVTWRSGVIAAGVLEAYLARGPGDATLPPMPSGVVTLLRQCFQSDPAARPANMQAVATALQGCYAEAVGQPYPRQAPLDEADSAFRLFTRGVSLSDLGEQEEALAVFEQALKLDSTFMPMWAGKAEALTRLQRYDEALEACEQALRLNPSSAEAWETKGSTLYQQKRYDEALAAYDQALRLDPSSAGAWLGKGEVLRNLKRSKEALAAIMQGQQMLLQSRGRR